MEENGKSSTDQYSVQSRKCLKLADGDGMRW